MASRNTRSSRNNQRTRPSETGRETGAVDVGATANMIASERESSWAVDVGATAAGAETNTESPNGRNSATKVRNPKKRTSKVWDHYTEIFVEETVDNKVIKKSMAACMYCDDVHCASSNQGTTCLWNHHHSFHDENDGKKSVKKSRSAGDEYDEETSLRKYYLAIIMHEYPFSFCKHEYTNDFIRSLCPNFPIKGRKTARTRIMAIFHKEKNNLYEYFSSLDCRFSCTMDVWTSNQNKGYLCVTCHFIDDEWKIQKRIVNFMHLEGRHTGANLSAAFMQNGSWNIDSKLFALTLDNASANDVCVGTIISILKNIGTVHCEGKFFHVRCAAHVINLVARDGVSTISTVIANIRALVLIVKSCNCLEIFYDATKILSGTHYPTSNLFFSEFCEINLKIIEWLKSNNSFIVKMARSMKEKFDKYWEMSNITVAVACFLDPRYKMKVVEFYYTEMSDNFGFDDMYEFKKVLQKIYDSYSSIYASANTSNVQQTAGRSRTRTRTSHCYVDLNEEPRRKRLSSFLRDSVDSDQVQSDLDQYTSEPLLNWKDGESFDILSWWKAHSGKYPILARVARDVLAIPATTVASESAFSSGGRVVNKYRSRLDPQMVETLICSKDWVRASRKDQSAIFSILEELIAEYINDEVRQDEGSVHVMSPLVS